jgi:hypothetical protein
MAEISPRNRFSQARHLSLPVNGCPLTQIGVTIIVDLARLPSAQMRIKA